MKLPKGRYIFLIGMLTSMYALLGIKAQQNWYGYEGCVLSVGDSVEIISDSGGYFFTERIGERIGERTVVLDISSSRNYIDIPNEDFVHVENFKEICEPCDWYVYSWRVITRGLVIISLGWLIIYLIITFATGNTTLGKWLDNPLDSKF